ncbi:TMEM165/GDT1 family protein [Sphingomonas sp. ERG5]|uniref:TMEM165/GDT1 family protein n=1 Tax=Sphingomonas sp. ERG5 TaxID=1381597 RepID=UPI00054C5B2C|nr:TMEM165/GDT1 family protein [Sphingomonas sp. ERG5]
MDALMAAFVAALLAQASDRTPWLTAILSTRFARPGAIILATAIALAIGNGVAAIGGMLIGPHMPPNARDLFLALALLSAGGSALFPIKPPDRLEGWRIGAFMTSLLGVAILAAGDRTQFITLAISSRSSSPALAAVGATIGALAVNIPAIMMGEAARKRLSIAAIRITIGILFLIVGTILGLGAIRLI